MTTNWRVRPIMAKAMRWTLVTTSHTRRCRMDLRRCRQRAELRVKQTPPSRCWSFSIISALPLSSLYSTSTSYWRSVRCVDQSEIGWRNTCFITFFRAATVRFSTTFNDDGCERTEAQILYPFIRRVSKESRVLPQGCLIYELDYSAHSYTYRSGEFSPTSLELYLPDQTTSYKIHLLSENMSISSYDNGRRKTATPVWLRLILSRTDFRFSTDRLGMDC